MALKRMIAAGMLTAMFMAGAGTAPALANDFARAAASDERPTAAGFYWQDPAFQGPPKGMYSDPEFQRYYETTLWPETMKAREVWSDKKQEITDLHTPSKLLMIGIYRKNINDYLAMHERMDEDCRRDRMSRGLSPRHYTDDVKWEM